MYNNLNGPSHVWLSDIEWRGLNQASEETRGYFCLGSYVQLVYQWVLITYYKMGVSRDRNMTGVGITEEM